MTQPTSTDNGAARFDPIAASIGRAIGAGIIARIDSFPKREALLTLVGREMDSLPERILWDGFGEEAPPVFVVYKLLHEALSTAPQFFRSALAAFMQAQPKRFPAVYNRETLWSTVMTMREVDTGATCPSIDAIKTYLLRVQRRGIWWRSDAEIEREAKAVFASLTGPGNGTFAGGVAALRKLQYEKGTGLTAGNLLLLVPGRLSAFADEVVSLGKRGELPETDELHARVDEFARDELRDGRHISVPIDLLYTSAEEPKLSARILVRAKANATARADIRRSSLYVRYFLRKAFATSELDLKLSFYLDATGTDSPWLAKDSLFNADEWTDRSAFWSELCPDANPEVLFAGIRDSAMNFLMKHEIVKKLKEHFIKPRTLREPDRSLRMSDVSREAGADWEGSPSKTAIQTTQSVLIFPPN